MLDRRFVFENASLIKENCARRHVPCNVDQFIELEQQRRHWLQEAQELNRKANEVSKSIGATKDPAERQRRVEEGRQLRDQKNAAQRKHDQLDAQAIDLLVQIPNLTHPDTPSGDESASRELRQGKTAIRQYPFKPLDHVAIGERLGLIDFEGGARVAGAGFYFLKNDAVLLELALQQFAVQFLVRRGFVPMTTPDLALDSVVRGIGFIPRGPETQIYSVENSELNLVATAEITLGGLYAGQSFELDQLPVKIVGISHCFRTEAGAAGRASRGLYRVHQFTKIEMFAFATADQSPAIHDEFRDLECEIFDALELPYRVIDIASGDLGGPAYRKFDLEAWMPGRGENGEWGEVTSTSNCTDYQSRRLDIRYRIPGQKGTELVHTLNGTAIAVSRAIVAILENHQQADGTVRVPAALQPLMGKAQIGN
jgi:seryl-tRNA synthetase